MNKSTFFVIKSYLLSMNDFYLECFLNDVLEMNCSDRVRSLHNMYNGLWDHYTGDRNLTNKWYYCDFGDYDNITFETDTNERIINRVINTNLLTTFIKKGNKSDVYFFIKEVNHFKRCF